MSDGRNFAVFVQGLNRLEDLDMSLEGVRMNAVRAINKIAPQARTKAAERIRAQVNFPTGYLSPAGKRLFVSRLARRGSLEAAITARSRPTSLARFIQGYTPGKKGVTVRVKPGSSAFMKNAFVVQLPAGKNIDTKSNLGLAIRLPKGQTLKGKRTAVKLDTGLYLLYGPSVDQVFINATGAKAGEGVATDPAYQEDILDDLEREFLRLWDLENGRL